MQKLFVFILSLLCIFSVQSAGQEFDGSEPDSKVRWISIRGDRALGKGQYLVSGQEIIALFFRAAAIGSDVLHISGTVQAPGAGSRDERQNIEAIIAEKDREIANKKLAIGVIIFLMVTKVFFMILTYVYWRKKKNLQIVNLENQSRIRELEHQQKILDERNRIAREMHDDLGTTLTSTLMAVEMVKRAPGATEPLEMIQKSSERLSGQINEIVWNLNTNNDNLIQLSSYMLRFARKFLSEAGIALTSEENLEESAVVVESYKRRSIFLVMKELLNNVVKHSGTKEVVLSINYKEQILSIQVLDKGKGFDASRIDDCGNGLNNIRQSVDRLDGKAVWNTHPSRGTEVIVEIPLQQL